MNCIELRQRFGWDKADCCNACHVGSGLVELVNDDGIDAVVCCALDTAYRVYRLQNLHRLRQAVADLLDALENSAGGVVEDAIAATRAALEAKP